MNDKTRSLPEDEDYQHAVDDMGTYIDASIEDLKQIEEHAKMHARLRRCKSIPVSDVMTSPAKTIHEDLPLPQAALILSKHKISTLPVVDADRKLVGIITEGDFLETIGIRVHHPSHTFLQTMESLFVQNRPIKTLTGNVSEIMTRQVIIVQTTDLIHEAFEKMKKHKVRRLIVCNQHHKVDGVLTQSDLIRLFFEHAWLA